MGIRLLERLRTPGGEKIVRPANSTMKNELVAMVYCLSVIALADGISASLWGR